MAKVNEMLSSIGGRRVDDDPGGAKWIGGYTVHTGGPSKTEEIGAMRDETRPKVTDWSAAVRAWTREPEASVEARLAKLEEQA